MPEPSIYLSYVREDAATADVLRGDLQAAGHNIAINRHSNRMLWHVARAVQAAEAGNAAQARDLLARALQEIDEIRQAETAAEYGQWKNWYAGDWLTNVSRTREAIQLFAQHLADPRAPLPSPLLWDWEAYYHIMHYEGDRSVDVK